MIDDALFNVDSQKKSIERRRFIFFSCIVVLTLLLTGLLLNILSCNGFQGFDYVLLPLFIVLTGIVSIGFCQAIIGFRILRRGKDFFRITNTIDFNNPPPLAKTAIVIPIFNEDVSRVFEELRVIYSSVQEMGKLEHFNFFILSDSSDLNKWVQEELAWVELCKQINGFDRIFYRKRRQAINRKSGNISDFCRRWGKDYRYMIVLDADSLMTGDTLIKLVQLMEQNPTVGIIQTAPKITQSESLFARIQQFSTQLYGPIFSAGLNYWQQGDTNFWGHNAIIRLSPFIEHCDLPDLPGNEPLGGRILSHDFVEAALMNKAGYSVWLAYDLEGSYELSPPTLIDYAKRDRRWCQGNLQHSWLIEAEGFEPMRRFNLLMSVMAYISSPLWLLFMIFSVLQMYYEMGFPENEGIKSIVAHFLNNLEYLPESFLLFILIMGMLFIPKFLCLYYQLKQPETLEYFGGKWKLITSTLLEMLLSTLLAPIHMLFISKFVLFAFLGKSISWVSQPREAEDGTEWREAILVHSSHTLAGFFILWFGWNYTPHLLPFLCPIIFGLLLSIPLSVCLSKITFGQKMKDWGFFLTPEEVAPQKEIGQLLHHLNVCYKHIQPLRELEKDYGLMQAVLDPYINALHISLLRQKSKTVEKTREYLNQIREDLLHYGPSSLSKNDKLALLSDDESMLWLHQQLWSRPQRMLGEWWQLAIRQYNVLTETPVTALYR